MNKTLPPGGSAPKRKINTGRGGLKLREASLVSKVECALIDALPSLTHGFYFLGRRSSQGGGVMMACEEYCLKSYRPLVVGLFGSREFALLVVGVS